MAEAKPPKPPKRRPPGKGDKLEIVKILVLAVISFGLGFALVFLVLRPSSSADEPEGSPSLPPTENASSLAQQGGDESNAPVESAQPDEQAGGGYAPSAPDEGEAPSEEGPDEGAAPPELKPGKTPDGMALDGEAYYLKCWDADGVEHPGKECDPLDVLEKRFATRLYVVDKCRRDKAGDSAEGKLSVAMEVDFQQMSISFWSGASSDIKNAAGIGTCLRTSMTGLPIHGVDHKNARYRVFFTVLFGGAAAKKEKQEAAKAVKFAAGKGKLVDVTKDRVNVRQTPKDGEVIGKISTGNQVRLLEQKAGWCHVVTPNDNDGWMICDALDL